MIWSVRRDTEAVCAATLKQPSRRFPVDVRSVSGYDRGVTESIALERGGALSWLRH